MLKLFFRDLGSDLSLDGLRLSTSDDLETMVLISLFTDRYAPEGTELPAGDTDRRGWCLDHTLPDTAAGTGDNIGSLLWLLRREKTTAATVAWAREIACQALEWMLDDGAVESLEVTAERVSNEVIGILVVLGREGETFSLAYTLNLTTINPV